MRKINILIAITGLLVIAYLVRTDIAYHDRHNSNQQPRIEPTADEYSQDHNCRMWAVISDNMPDSVIYNHLVGYDNSLKNLAEVKNIDGWGIAYYDDFGEAAVIQRGAMRAFNDPVFDTLTVQIENAKPDIALAHVRNCSAGCCAHGSDSIPDPHPFIRFKDDKYWLFEHNGTISKSLLYDLVGSVYLHNNPLTGSDIPECDPSDTSMVIDSELYFLYLLKNIEENNWDAAGGITAALVELQEISSDEALNFILSDGYDIWSFCMARSLYYLDESPNGYTALASMYPTRCQDNWQTVSDYEMVILRDSYAPEVIDIGEYLPSIAGTITNDEAEPIEGVYVYTRNPDFGDSTDINGEYSLEHPCLGSYRVYFSHPYYSDTSIFEVEVFADSTTSLNIAMSNPGTLTGIVANSYSMPVSDVYVSIKFTTYSDTTNNLGGYILDSLNSGRYHISFTHPYYSDTLTALIDIPADTAINLNIELADPGVIMGLVTKQDSNPLDSVYVYVQRTSFYDTTDADGEYIIDSLDRGEYGIIYSHPDYRDTTVSGIECNSNDTTYLNVIMVLLPGSIAGVVANDTLGIIEGVHVAAEGTDIYDITDEDGEYLLGNLDYGVYNISYSCLGYRDTLLENIEVTPGDITTQNAVLNRYSYLVGDVNMYLGCWPPTVIGSDVIYLVNKIRGYDSSIPCLIDDFWVSADVNGDCSVIGSDVTRLINYFKGISTVVYCPNYIPKWILENDIPLEAPEGWPACDTIQGDSITIPLYQAK